MSVKFVLICVQTLLIQSALSQCLGAIDAATAYGWASPGLPPSVYDGIPTPLACDGLGWVGSGYDIPVPCGYDGLGWADPSLAPGIYDGLATPYGYDGLGWIGRGSPCDGFSPRGFLPSGGSSFRITSVSPIQPTGISIVSENTFEGPLTVVGEMPFLAVVSLDGVLPTLGAGAINHACGNGVSAMISEGLSPTPYGPYPYGPGPYATGIGYGAPGCGCGLPY